MSQNFTRLELVDSLSQQGWQQIDDDSWTHPDREGECLDTIDALAAQAEMDTMLAEDAANDAYMAQFNGDV